MAPRYSVCITHYNNVQTVERSLGSVVDQVDDRFEVVVVDQNSADGSLEVLERFAKEGVILLYHQKVHNRGLGRQLSFEKSKGEYIISQVDMDDLYEPVLGELVTSYERSMAGKVVRVVSDQKRGAVTIAPRRVLEEIGGWPDLNYVEDRWVWGLAAERGLYGWIRYPLYSKITQSREKRSFLSRVGRVYGIQRDRVRIGATPHISRSTWPLYPLSYAAAVKARRLVRPIFRSFWPDDPKYSLEGLANLLRV